MPLDAILTEVSVALVRERGGRACAAAYRDNALAEAEPRVSAARTGVAVFADDFQTIKVFAERDNANIVHWSRFERGGHFAALEVPELVVGDIRAFFADARPKARRRARRRRTTRARRPAARRTSPTRRGECTR